MSGSHSPPSEPVGENDLLQTLESVLGQSTETPTKVFQKYLEHRQDKETCSRKKIAALAEKKMVAWKDEVNMQIKTMEAAIMKSRKERIDAFVQLIADVESMGRRIDGLVRHNGEGGNWKKRKLCASSATQFGSSKATTTTMCFECFASGVCGKHSGP